MKTLFGCAFLMGALSVPCAAQSLAQQNALYNNIAWDVNKDIHKLNAFTKQRTKALKKYYAAALRYNRNATALPTALGRTINTQVTQKDEALRREATASRDYGRAVDRLNDYIAHCTRERTVSFSEVADHVHQMSLSMSQAQLAAGDALKALEAMDAAFSEMLPSHPELRDMAESVRQMKREAVALEESNAQAVEHLAHIADRLPDLYSVDARK